MRALDTVIRGAYEIGALAAGERAGRLYQSLGWQRWRGRTWALTPRGVERTSDDDDSTYVLPVMTPIDVGRRPRLRLARRGCLVIAIRVHVFERMLNYARDVPR